MNVLDVEDQARRYVGEGGFPGDATNAYFNVAMNLGDEAAEQLIKPARTYENYLREVKCKGNPDLVDAILRATDPAKVTLFDVYIGRINTVLQNVPGAKDREYMIRPILEKLKVLV